MRSQHTLQVARRERTGSRYARRERAAGRLPAVLYGHGKEPVHLTLDAHEALRFFHLGEKVFDIRIPDETATETVLLKDLQFDYLGTNVVHVDLARVDLNEEIEANVPIHLVGEAVGLKTAGAMLVHPATSVNVKCTVANLPDGIDVSISELGVGESIHARDVPMPAGVELAGDEEAVVASIIVKKVEEEEVGEAEDVEAEVASPEVITEKKDEEKESGEA